MRIRTRSLAEFAKTYTMQLRVANFIHLPAKASAVCLAFSRTIANNSSTVNLLPLQINKKANIDFSYVKARSHIKFYFNLNQFHE